MILTVAQLHDYADLLEDKYNRTDLAETIDKIAHEILARYQVRIRRPRRSRGPVRTKRRLYYKMHRQKLRTRMRRYRTLHRNQLSRRKRLKHYHRFG
jgi:hypothetical protein